MQPARNKPRWQQVTALVSLGAGGAIAGFHFVPKSPADLTSPAGLPVHLMALERSAQPPSSTSHDAMLRSAIVKVSTHFLRMAEDKSPAQMEALIWQQASIDGVDHGPSCAAFASLTLELAANMVGEQSWVTGGTTYPWPLHKWIDARVDANPSSLGITSILQDAQSHGRWHPMGDGYMPQPGDWVLFEGHVEVVTGYSGGVLTTIGGDSGPNYSVNAHEYRNPLSAQGVQGFVNNGDPGSGSGTPQAAGGQGDGGQNGGGQGSGGQNGGGQGDGGQASLDRAHVKAGGGDVPGATHAPAVTASPGGAAIPGMRAPDPSPHRGARGVRAGDGAGQVGAQQPRAPGRSRPAARASRDQQALADMPGTGAAAPAASSGTVLTAKAGAADIPGVPAAAPHRPAELGGHGGEARGAVQPPPAVDSQAAAQRDFIRSVAPGAAAAQRRYGVPAAVTIAQAIEESGWGRSALATSDYNLFGMKGTGPAGSAAHPTQEFEQGRWVTRSAFFRVYHSTEQSIDDHGRLLASGEEYRHAMALARDPNAFANALTGVYATDPGYGSKLIKIMEHYHLYRYDVPAAAASPHGGGAAHGGAGQHPATAHKPAIPPKAGTPRKGGPRGSGRAPQAGGTPQSGRTPKTGGAPEAGRTPQPGGGPGAAATQHGGGSPWPGSPGAGAGKPGLPGASAGQAAAGQHGAGAAGVGPAGAGPAGAGKAGAGKAGAGRAARGQAGSSGADKPRPSLSPPRSRGQQAGAAARGDGGRQPSLAGARAAGGGNAEIPGLAVAAPTPPASAAASAKRVDGPGGAGQRDAQAQAGGAQAGGQRGGAGAARAGRATPSRSPSTTQSAGATRLTVAERPAPPPARSRAAASAAAYQPQIPASVRRAFASSAKGRLEHNESVYHDVCLHNGLRWELLAACDWMQCEAKPRYSPVHGEKLGTANPDGTVFRTRSGALAQCADDLIRLAHAVYRIDVTVPGHLSVTDLANAFAAFRWGALLRAHRTSAMEFPYSVAGLTPHHTRMRWPDLGEHGVPDKQGSRFHMSFGAVPVVLLLNYPATA